MSREIKFRAWDKYHKCILKMKGQLDADVFDLVGNDKYELMQYTGLKDKNGAEVFEGDIIKNMNVVQEVVFNPKSAAFQMGNGYHLRQIDLAYEVIGNIYESPELIEESK